MNKSVIIKILAVVILLFAGNRIFNHVDAWIGIAIMVAGLVLALYYIFKPIKNNENNDEEIS